MSDEPKNENADCGSPAKPADNHVNIAEQMAALNARWILTRSATPWGARAHQGKIDFSFPLRRLPLRFEMRRRLRGKEKQVGSKHWGVALRVRIHPQVKSFAKELKESRDKHKIDNEKQYRLERRVACGIGIYTIITLGILIASLYQVGISRDTEKRQLRPYVNISTPSLNNANPAGPIPEWRIPVIIENNGATQTRDAISKLWCAQKDFAGDDPMKSPSSGRIKRFLGPRQNSVR